jgi:hypothetical protein
MKELTSTEITKVGGGTIDQPNELAAGLIMAGAAGMVGALLGAAGGPVGMAAGGVTGARLGLKFVEWITP